MKKNVFIIFALFFLLFNATGQTSIELNFDADNNGSTIVLDSIKIQNLTQNAEIILPANVTSYTLLITSINDLHLEGQSLFHLSQNYPNPFTNKTSIEFSLLTEGNVNIAIYDLLGRELYRFNNSLKSGNHLFTFQSADPGAYLCKLNAFGTQKTIKMFSTGQLKGRTELQYMGEVLDYSNTKSVTAINDLPFELGDVLLYVAYSSSEESGILDSPEVNSDYIFQFATNIPCIDAPTVEYEGQIYNTIQIYSQCWFKENLNVGEMIPASQSQTNNNTIEKYCPLDDEYYCNTFAGALYLWSEMMDYANEPGAQGICPEGWHIPTDLDWQVLEGAVDSGYGIGNPEWANTDWRGSDAGGNLKQTGTTNWMSPNTGATDAFGFTALPGGYIVQGEYWGGMWKGYFWSSHNVENFFRNMDWNQKTIKRDNGVGGGLAISVRCMKD